MGSPNDQTFYRALVRVPTALWDTVAEDVGKTLAFLSVDRDPPRAGPEVELSFYQAGLSEDEAEARARRRLEAYGLTVLAIRMESYQ